jgi:hypothetical protein
MVIADGFFKPPRKRPESAGAETKTRFEIRVIPRRPVSRAAGSVRVALDPGFRRDDVRATRP